MKKKFIALMASQVFITCFLNHATASDKEVSNLYTDKMGRVWMECGIGTFQINNYCGGEQESEKPRTASFPDTVEFVRGLTYAGRNGWRIPSIKETIEEHVYCVDSYNNPVNGLPSYDSDTASIKCPEGSWPRSKSRLENRLLLGDLIFSESQKWRKEFENEAKRGAELARKGQGSPMLDYCLYFNGGRDSRIIESVECLQKINIPGLVLINDGQGNENWYQSIKQDIELMKKYQLDFITAQKDMEKKSAAVRKEEFEKLKMQEAKARRYLKDLADSTSKCN